MDSSFASTAITLKIFKNKEDAIRAPRKLVNLPMSIFTNVDNFNPKRLQRTAVEAYPLENRPRGGISSVEYHREQIRQNMDIGPIWLIIQNDETYLLLDGAHRIVAHYIEGEQYINAYVIQI